MGGSGGIGMVNWGILDGGDGYSIDCCDDCVGGVCDGGWIDTEECGDDGAVFGLVEGRNVGYVEGYSRGESGW